MNAPSDMPLQAGLSKAAALTHLGYAELSAGIQGNREGASWFARSELGLRKGGLSAFAFGEAKTSGYAAGVGARWEF